MTATAAPPRVILNAPSVKIAAAYGRLYVTGSHADLLRRLPGATPHDRTRSIQLSLTLETLRAIRQTLGVTKEQMARYCTDEVLRWARAAGEQERKLLALHQRISQGERLELPWADHRGGTLAPAGSPDDQIEWLSDGIEETRRWKRRAPFAHQQIMAMVAVELDGCAFLCEQGTAKTRAALEAAQEKARRGQIDLVLVLCPKGVMNVWERETANWTDRLLAKQMRGILRQRREQIEFYRNAPPRTDATPLLILNYDVVADLEEPLAALMDARRVMLIEDEMHKIKNPQAQVTRACMELARHAAHRLGLTGTPVTNGAEEIWSQWYTIDLGITFGANFVQFRREFFHEYKWSWDVTPQAGALDVIGNRLRLRGLRYRKEDCLDLPPKVYEVEEVDMTAEQARAYEQMRDDLVAWLANGARGRALGAAPDETDDSQVATAANQLVAILRLTQITSGFIPAVNGTVHHFDPNPKLRRIAERVREVLAGDRSVIVWATYKHDITALMREFAGLRPLRIDGSQQGVRGEQERNDAELLFASRERRLLIANPAAGGVGLNLQAASHAMYYSQNYSLVNRLQSEDRCHRAGSQIHNRVTYTDYVCSGTIDETVREALASKKDTADAVVDLRRAIGA